jgi:hypothetical protein
MLSSVERRLAAAEVSALALERGRRLAALAPGEAEHFVSLADAGIFAEPGPAVRALATAARQTERGLPDGPVTAALAAEMEALTTEHLRELLASFDTAVFLTYRELFALPGAEEKFLERQARYLDRPQLTVDDLQAIDRWHGEWYDAARRRIAARLGMSVEEVCAALSAPLD